MKMESFIYSSGSDYVSALKYRVKCAMEKTSGVIIEDGVEFHIDVNGHFMGGKYPKFVTEVRSLLETLVRAH